MNDYAEDRAVPSESLGTHLDYDTSDGPICLVALGGIHDWWLIELGEYAVYECEQCKAQAVA